MSPNCHDIRWDTYCFSNVTVSPQNLCLFSLSDTRISRNASGELISAARLILSASAQERLNFGMVAGKPNLSNTVGKRMTYRISYEDGLAASADFEGGSPEEVCTTKEIRGAEVNVLSMCGRAGTAASSLAIPRGASSGISCDEVFSGRLVETRHIEGNDAEMAAQQVVSRRQILTHSRAELADQLRPAVQQRKYLAFLGRRQTDVHSGDAKVAVAFQQIQVFRSAAQRH